MTTSKLASRTVTGVIAAMIVATAAATAANCRLYLASTGWSLSADH